MLSLLDFWHDIFVKLVLPLRNSLPSRNEKNLCSDYKCFSVKTASFNKHMQDNQESLLKNCHQINLFFCLGHLTASLLSLSSSMPLSFYLIFIFYSSNTSKPIPSAKLRAVVVKLWKQRKRIEFWSNHLHANYSLFI